VNDDPADADPIRARRARIARMVAIGKRIGYTALLVAIVAFFAGLVLQFPGWSVFLTVAGLVVACVVLPLPIVVGFGVRAAEREDRGP
jgi:ABC-type molybdate transport system permease subunit